MNFSTKNCWKCGKETLISHDEWIIFKKAVCIDCDNPTKKFIRHKIVYKFYEIPEVTDQIIESIIEKEFKMIKGLRNVNENKNT